MIFLFIVMFITYVPIIALCVYMAIKTITTPIEEPKEEKFVSTYYVPIYEWGEAPTTTLGMVSGCMMYQDLRDLYGFENKDGQVVGYFEVSGCMPTKEEFEENEKGTD